MGYTGYKVIQYIDDNPNSPTYGETWTELVLDTEHCPNGSGDWELVSSNCELSTSGYTGRRVYTYYNNVTNEYSSTTSADSSCKTSSLDEIWTNSGDSYCEVDEDGKYTGYGLQRQVQTNSNLINYKEIRDVRVTKTECLEELEPVWQDLYKVCHIEQNPGGTLYYDGTADILQIDINPSSESYNQTRTINVPDEECALVICDSIVEEWKFVDDYCGNNVPANYNLSNLTYNTVYHIYQKYQKCIYEGEVVRETPTGVYSAETYQTEVSDCQYRWVDTEETVCVEAKYTINYSDNTTYSFECNGNSTLSNEDMESLPEKGNVSSIEIGSCVTTIGTYFMNGNYAQNASAITIPDSVTTLERTALVPNNFVSVTIPSGVTEISELCLSESQKLVSVELPSGLTKICNYAFRSCTRLSGITLPNSLTNIGREAFKGCLSFTSITIPASVNKLYNMAFENCTGLTSVTILATTPPAALIDGWDAWNAFDGTTCPIYVPSGSVNAYKTAQYWSKYADRIMAIPNS